MGSNFAFGWLLTISLIVDGTNLPLRMLRDLDERANASTERYDLMEVAIMTSRTHLSRGTPAWYLGVSHAILPEARNLSRRAIRREMVSTMLVEAMNMTPKEAAAFLPSVRTATSSICAVEPKNPSTVSLAKECGNLNERYRSQSGRCNNPSRPSWGSALISYARLMPAEYADGVSLPRWSSSLPSAREVSLGVHSGGLDQPHPHLMALTALFGQFVAHDLSHTPKVELPNGQMIKCCDVDYEHFHPECFPIRAEERSKDRCMEYARSAPHPGDSYNHGCSLGPRQQINQATSYLDLSPLYGVSEEITRILRLGVGGLLRTQRKDLPMASTEPENCRSDPASSLPCFLSGDSRVNENPGLALIHVIFLREHNRIAKQLATLNNYWDDEILFQETRRIVIAEFQHIIYNEFLPVVLGESAIDRWNLRLTTEGYFKGYRPQIDATISNAAASAGLLFVAAITPKTLDLVDTRSKKFFKSGERSLLSSFYAPQELYEAGAIDRLIAGATAGHSRKPAPPGLNEILLERYFHDGKSDEAPIDLAAQYIQQGRDHGIPSYTKWRQFCGLSDVTSFSDFLGTVSKEAIRRLGIVYRNITDIDLVTGAFAEAPTEGSIVGPTFSCLLGRTFRNIRMGDRYWYENRNTPGSFTPDQLEEIRRSSMARLLCNNGDRLSQMQPRSFILTDPFLNPMTNCSLFADQGRLDLTPWKSDKTPTIL